MARITAADLDRLEGKASLARTANDLEPVIAEAKTFDQDDFRDGFLLKTIRLRDVLVANAHAGSAEAPVRLPWGTGS